MHGADFMETLEPIDNLFEKISCLILSESFFALQIMLEVASITKLCCDHYGVVGREGINVSNDVLVFAGLENFYLCFDELVEFRCFLHQLLGDNLDGDLAAIPFVERFVYFREGSLAKHVNEGEGLYLLSEPVLLL